MFNLPCLTKNLLAAKMCLLLFLRVSEPNSFKEYISADFEVGKTLNSCLPLGLVMVKTIRNLPCLFIGDSEKETSTIVTRSFSDPH